MAPKLSKPSSWFSRKTSGQKTSRRPASEQTAEPSNELSVHRPLDFSRKFIRLLELDYAEGNVAGPIRCKLIETSLDTAPPYETLSYVWGNPSDTVPLNIGGRTLQITRNLDVALRHIRRTDVVERGPRTTSCRRIWVDAICINQGDLQERGEQVRLMFHLYKKAARVLIWLGEEHDDSDIAMRLILRMQAAKLASVQRQVPGMVLGPYEQSQVDQFANEEPWYHSLMKLHGSSGGEHINPQDPREWVAFQRLMQRPWWRRMWVVQELAAAEDRALVGCGRKWIPWTPFVMAALAIQDMKEHPFLQRLRRLALDVGVITDLSAICYRMDGRLNNFNGMILLLYYTQSKQATLPVDRVYALIGLTPSIPMLPDYTKTAEEVYKTFVKLSIGTTGSLAMLSFVRFPKKLHLPTWTPDFSCEYAQDEYNITVPIGVYGADGNAGCRLFSSDEEDELTVLGHHYDRPVYIGKTWQGAAEERDSSLFDILEDFENAMNDVDGTTYQEFPEEFEQVRYESLWRTLVWNATPESRYPAPDTYGDFYREIAHSKHTLVDHNGLSSGVYDPDQHQRIIPMGPCLQYYESLVKHSLNRRCFITSMGYLGSGPREMQPGDLVCVLLGYKTPVILRRSERRQGCFEWVGPAYVHGIMHAEVVAEVVHQGRAFKLV